MAQPKFLTIDARVASTLTGIAMLDANDGELKAVLYARLPDGPSKQIAQVLFAEGVGRTGTGMTFEREVATEMKKYMTPSGPTNRAVVQKGARPAQSRVQRPPR